MVKLDILSDPICPWCYIGKAGLDRALAGRADHPFAIEWHPFRLNPEMPAGGMDRGDYLAAKFGGEEAAREVHARIAARAAEAGLTMNLDAIRRTPDTLDAHRLIHWAGIEGRQTPVVSRLFEAYFEHGEDIGDHGVLAAVAAAAGMEADAARRLLASDADTDDIRARDAHARERGVTGVPTFVVAERHVVPGAQPPGFWEQVLADLSAPVEAGP